MEIRSISAFCKYFYRSYQIPITCMTEKQIVFQYPSSLSCLDIESLVPDSQDDSSFSISFFMALDTFVFGIISLAGFAGDVSLIVGPVTTTYITVDKVKMQLEKVKTHRMDNIAFLNMTSNIPVLYPERFFDVVSFINYCLTDTWTDAKELLHKEDAAVLKNIEKSYVEHLLETKEQMLQHNSTYFIAMQLVNCIRNGDIEELAVLSQIDPQSDDVTIKYAQPTAPIILADDSLRNNKNIFITVSALITQAAVEGGLNVETALELFSSYIRQCEKTKEPQQTAQLLNKIALDFATRVKECQIPKNISSLTFNCIQFISSHINVAFTVSDMAERFQINRSYLSTVFKNEMGCTIRDYIVTRKIEVAKNLLGFTKMSISEIGNYLCFSSQAHFQTVFKNETGLTPNQYRNQYQDYGERR